jgi:hypothetical protein
MNKEKENSAPEGESTADPSILLQSTTVDFKGFHDRLIDKVRNYHSSIEGYTYRHVMQAELNQVDDYMAKNQYVVDGKVVNKNVTFDRRFEAAMPYQCGASIRMLKLQVVVKKLALIQLYNSTLHALNNGSLYIVFICMRSALEQISHYASTLRDVSKITCSLGAKDEEINRTIWEIHEMVLKNLYSTRFNWEGFLSNDQEIGSASSQYIKDDLRIDLSSEQVLNSINYMNKAVKNVRRSYELLCEFAHPNSGLILSSGANNEIEEDVHGFHWIKKNFHQVASADMVERVPRFLGSIMKVLDESIEYFDLQVKNGEKEIDRVQKLIQIYLRPMLSARSKVLDRYSICPCDSGKKVKFCCGQR